jgi:hypothetical protein
MQPGPLIENTPLATAQRNLDQQIAEYQAAQRRKIAVILSREEIATIRAALNVAEKDAGDKFGMLWDRFNDIYSSMVNT